MTSSPRFPRSLGSLFRSGWRRVSAIPAAAVGTALWMAAGSCWLPGQARAKEMPGTKPIDFNREIRPILSDRCFFCHGPDEHDRKAGLRLDTLEGATADLGGYAAIVPGELEASEFYLRIVDAEDPMPPAEAHKELSPEEIALLSRWIEQGAPWAEPWAYVPPQPHPEPETEDGDWPLNWIDRFVLARLEAEGLGPSPEADPVTLLRRLHFDLAGLPPTPEEVAAFLKASDGAGFERAWEDLVDRLLASPHFGERLAIYWLDLVRYADTVGYHGDQDHNIAPYREYVIRAFNDNLPFDRFTREQLAGDLLPEAGVWQRVASGYNRLLQTSHEGGVQLEEYDAIYAADRVRNLSAVWMGATVGCAQCHDHKYDPYTLRDHYALAAFFADIHDRGFGGNSLPAQRPPEIAVFDPADEAELARLAAEIEAVLPLETRERLEALEIEATALETRAARSRNAEEKAGFEVQAAALREDYAAAAPDEGLARWEALRAERAAVAELGRPTMIVEAQPPRPTRVLARGDWQDESGEIIEPAVPAFLGGIETQEGHRADRLDLAKWLTNSETGAGGLTARVFANRFWYLFFGTGISRSLEDFGGQGEPPANPELLDRLALAFQESGWDVKATLRLLVTSRAYRQSSLDTPERVERDPHRQLASRQSRYRLPAELVRDHALAVSGLLVDEPSALSVKPYQPAGYYKHLNFPKRDYEAHLDPRQWRRGVYMHWQRMFLHPMLQAMDAPSREECVAERPRSNTPNAALVLLNDPSFVEAARVFAVRVLAEAGEGGFDERLERAYLLALSRLPDEEERLLMARLFELTRAEYESKPEEAAGILAVGIAPAPEGADPVELATWTAVTRALLNLSEAITRN